MDENYSQTSARQAKPRFRLQARALAFSAKGGGPAEPVLQKESVLPDVVKSTCHPELDSGSIRHGVLPVTLDRSRNGLARLAKNGTAKSVVFALSLRSLAQFGMTLKEMTLVCGFTMAEILLSLTIIGVVAAITLPSLTGNINERTWNTQRKALYARFSQAIALMPAMNGYGTLDSSDTHNVTETFLTAGLTKVLKINNICNKDSLPDCGIASSMTNAQGSKMDIPVKISDLYSKNINVELFGSYSGSSVTYADINAAAFETANGESILAFYNPNCNAKDVLSVENALHIPEKMCANFIYDLNGTKGPNTFGKDIGIISVFYPTDSVVVAPMPFLRGGDLEVNWSEANSSCKNIDSEYRAPNLEEMMALQYNHNVSNLANTRYWTNSREGENAWQVTYTNKGMLSPVDSTVEGGEVFSVRCVKR